MSLFAGTSFLAGSSSTPSSTSTPTKDDSKPSPAAPASSSASTPTPTPGPSTVAQPGWSAALKFAPASRKPKPSASSSSGVRALPAGFTPTTASSSAASSIPGLYPTQAPAPPPQDIIRTAEPQLYAGAGEDAAGKKIFRPPAMTLAAEGGGKVNPRKRPGEGGEGPVKKKKGRKHNKPNLHHPIHHFSPNEAYDPSKPNDLSEYQAYRKARRQEKKEERAREEAERRRGGGSESDEGSYYSEDEEEEEEREKEKAGRVVNKGFAPPSSLYAPPSTTKPAPIYPTDPDPYSHPPPPPPVASQPAPATGDEAYARRLALSSRTETADEAYARRVALSASSGGVAREPAFASSSGTYVPPTQQPQPSLYSSFIPPAPTPPAPAAPVDDADFQKRLEERKAAAEAVAKRLAAFSAGAMAPQAQVGLGMVGGNVGEGEVEGGTFAEKMMRKMGHKEGKGLGVNGSGIIHAFSAQHTSSPASSSSKKGGGKWVQAKSAHGKLVNLNEDERERENRERYGEPSRVVCLGNVVGSRGEVDEELAGEMGEECGKYGIVERVVLHMVEPEPADPADGVRIFIVYSGLAGAWKSVKELDGRFFGGRSLRAVYFDEARFNKGDRNGSLL